MEITEQWMADNGASFDVQPDEIMIWSLQEDRYVVGVARVGTVVEVAHYVDPFGIGVLVQAKVSRHDHADMATAVQCVANAREGFVRIDQAEAVGGDPNVALDEFTRELIASGQMTYPRASEGGSDFRVI